MRYKVSGGVYDAETLNRMYEQGYRYYCFGDYKESGYNSRDGMPNYDYNTYFFSDEGDAEAFAEKEKQPFSNDYGVPVRKIPEHSVTQDEFRKANDDRKVAAQQRKKDNLIKRAYAAGVSEKDAEAWEKTRLKINKVNNEISANERTIQDLTAKNAELQTSLEKLNSQLASYEGREQLQDSYDPSESLRGLYKGE